MESNANSKSPSGSQVHHVNYGASNYQPRYGASCNYYPVSLPKGSVVSQSPILFQGYTPGMSPIFSPTFWNSPSGQNSGLWSNRLQPQPYDQSAREPVHIQPKDMHLNELLAGKQKQVQQSRSTLLRLHHFEERDDELKSGFEKNWQSLPRMKEDSLKSELLPHLNGNEIKTNERIPTSNESFDESKRNLPKRLSPDEEANIHHAVPVDSSSPNLSRIPRFTGPQMQPENIKLEEARYEANQSFSQPIYPPLMAHYVCVPVHVESQGSPRAPVYAYNPDHVISGNVESRVLTERSNMFEKNENKPWLDANSNVGYHNNGGVEDSSRNHNSNLVDLPLEERQKVMDNTSSALREILGKKNFHHDLPNPNHLYSDKGYSVNDGSQVTMKSEHYYSDQSSKEEQYTRRTPQYASNNMPKIQPNDDQDFSRKSNHVQDERKMQQLAEHHRLSTMQLQQHLNSNRRNQESEYWATTEQSQNQRDSQHIPLHNGGNMRSGPQTNKISNLLQAGWPDNNLPGLNVPAPYIDMNDRTGKRSHIEMQGSALMKGANKYPFQSNAAPKKARQKIDELQTSLHQLQSMNQRLAKVNETLRSYLQNPYSSHSADPQRSLAKLSERNTCLRHAILELESLCLAGKSVSDDQLTAALSRCNEILLAQDDPIVVKNESRMARDYGEMKMDKLTLYQDRNQRELSWSMRDAAKLQSHDQSNFINRYPALPTNHDSANTLLTLASSPRTRIQHSMTENMYHDGRTGGIRSQSPRYSNLTNQNFRGYA